MDRNAIDLKVGKLYYYTIRKKIIKKKIIKKKKVYIALTPSPQHFSLISSKLFNTSDN